MGHHPTSAAWLPGSGNTTSLPEDKPSGYRLSDAQCAFINANVGVSRRTLRDVCNMLNDKFELGLSFEAFSKSRADAIAEGRCRSTYFRNYFKGENSSERELRRQKPLLISRLTGGCQFKAAEESMACGKATSGRYCEAHARAGHIPAHTNNRGTEYIDSTLGRYG